MHVAEKLDTCLILNNKKLIRHHPCTFPTKYSILNHKHVSPMITMHLICYNSFDSFKDKSFGASDIFSSSHLAVKTQKVIFHKGFVVHVTQR